jgi:glucose/arabinose dehydrogenase
MTGSFVSFAGRRSSIMRFSLFPVAAASGAALFSQAVLADDKTVKTETGTISVRSVASGLDHPWGLSLLQDGRMLVTERPGRLRIIHKQGKISDPVGGVPKVFAQGQGGLLDVAVDPDFASNNWVYLSYAEPGDGGASTALGRGRLYENRLEDFHVLFRQQPKIGDNKHFGGRIAFAPDGRIFLTLGERFTFAPAQDTSNHLGTVVRINKDGSMPDDNPFIGKQDAKDEIWSYGHRNIEAATIQPSTGRLWIAEMGPEGGDELNVPEAGRNYGWPLVSWGEHYDGRDIPNPPTRSEFADAVKYWTPVISPSGMAFYNGVAFPEWRGNILIGGLSSQGLVRLVVDGRKVTHEERIPLQARIRDVAEASDGSIYVLTDQSNGDVWRLTAID